MVICAEFYLKTSIPIPTLLYDILLHNISFIYPEYNILYNILYMIYIIWIYI